jgi:lipopolysaccharide export system protein LptA
MKKIRVFLVLILSCFGVYVIWTVFQYSRIRGKAPAPIRETPVLPTPDNRGEIPGEQIQSSAKEFETRKVEKGREVYRIRAARAFMLKDGTLVLSDDIQVHLVTGGGEELTLRSNSGTYNQKKEEFTLSGNVWMFHEKGFSLQTRELRYQESKELVRCRRKVSFFYKDQYKGVCEDMDYDIARERATLRGYVRFWFSDKPDSRNVASDTCIADKKPGVIVFSGDAVLNYDGNQLTAPTMEARLVEKTWELREIEGRGSEPKAVATMKGAVELESPAPGATLELPDKKLEAEKVSLVFDSGDHRLTEMVAVDTDSAKLEYTPAGKSSSQPLELLAAEIHVFFGAGGLYASEGKATGNVRCLMKQSGPEERKLTTDLLLIHFDEATGRLRSFTMPRKGRISKGDTWGEGNRCEYALATGDASFVGKARAYLDGMTVWADTLHSDAATETLDARDNVRAETEKGGDSAVVLPFGKGQEPTYISSEKLEVLQKEKVARFTGKVKAWKGNDLILADSLVMDRSRGVLEASGEEVRSSLHPATRADDKDPGGASDFSTSSGELEYISSEGKAAFRKNATVGDGKINIQAGTVEAFFDREDSTLSKLTAEDEKEIRVRSKTGTVTGERMEYYPGEKMVHIFGSSKPLELIDDKNQRFTGNLLTMYTDNDRIQIESYESGKSKSVIFPHEGSVR